MHASSSPPNNRPHNVTYVGTWTETVPHTSMSRVEFMIALSDAYRASVIQDVRQRDHMFKFVAKVGILSVGQLAEVFCISRQRIYIMLMKHRINIPDPNIRKQGTLNGRSLEYVSIIVKVIQKDGIDAVNYDMLAKLPYCGSAGILKLLTGIDCKSYAPYRPFNKKKYTVRLS